VVCAGQRKKMATGFWLKKKEVFTSIQMQ
jgi:hypothetical protein